MLYHDFVKREFIHSDFISRIIVFVHDRTLDSFDSPTNTRLLFTALNTDGSDVILICQ